MDLLYQEYVPSPPLGRYVRCLWSLRGVSSPAPQTIVPDGCAEILLNCAGPVVQLSTNGRGVVQPKITLIGEVRRPVTIGEGVVADMVGVRLMPGALGVLLDEPSHRLIDGTLDLDALFPARDRLALQAVSGEEDVPRRIALIECWLLERLRRSTVDDRLVRRAVQIIEATNGMAPIERLAAELAVQRRSLERAFKGFMGISPKSFSRVRRFRRVLSLIEGGQPFADAAISCGYFDQAHLISDFRTYAGKSPSAYLRSSHDLDQLFGGDSAKQPAAEVAARA